MSALTVRVEMSVYLLTYLLTYYALRLGSKGRTAHNISG